MPRQSESTLAAIKQANPIVALVGEYLPLHRVGGKFKALCPFHDDHNPSLELNDDRQSFKCWSCGAGGDVFDFVKEFERVDFSEAVRMLAERAGITLDRSDARGLAPQASGPSKTDLWAVCEWAEGVFAEALALSTEARAYAESRGISGESQARFRLGFAPDHRDWLSGQGRRAGFSLDLLIAAGLVARSPESNLTRDRFRGRLIFPIHDQRGRPIGFGGRILPESEKKLVENNLHVAKYLNSPETLLFQKRRHLYAADLALLAGRSAGWVAVMEGYTDVIAAHQAGLPNVVATLGTALGDDHIQALRGFNARVVLIFDGDEAGQKAADRSLELFLGHEIDVRVLTLPDNLDPADFLRDHGADAFRKLVAQATDPLVFLLDRAAEKHDFASAEGARQAAQWLLAILAKIPPAAGRGGLDLKVAKALGTMAHRLGIPEADLKRQLHRGRTPVRGARVAEPSSIPTPPQDVPVRLGDLDPLGRELVQIALNEPRAVTVLARQFVSDDLRDPLLRGILQACYDIHAEGLEPDFNRVALRLDDREKSLAVGLLMPPDRQPFTERVQPAPWSDRLEGVLHQLAVRQWEEKTRDLQAALQDADLDPADRQALRAEYLRHLGKRPVPIKR